MLIEMEGVINTFEEPKSRYGLYDRIKAFVLDVFQFADQLPKSPAGRAVNSQLCRSASSVGANYRASWRARSDREYIAKLGIAEEEADETCYWLDIIRSANWSLEKDATELYQEADQLTAIIVSLIKRKKQQMKA